MEWYIINYWKKSLTLAGMGILLVGCCKTSCMYNVIVLNHHHYPKQTYKNASKMLNGFSKFKIPLKSEIELSFDTSVYLHFKRQALNNESVGDFHHCIGHLCGGSALVLDTHLCIGHLCRGSALEQLVCTYAWFSPLHLSSV